MNYQYGEAFLEITFKNGNKTRIKRDVITDIYSYKDDKGENVVMVYFARGGSSSWYKFDGTFEEFEQNSKVIYL